MTESKENFPNENLIIGMMKWLPIQEKALETLSEYEKRKEKGITSHFISIGDIIYYALVLFHDDIISDEESAYDSLESIQREYMNAQKKNLHLMTEFGAMDKKSEKWI